MPSLHWYYPCALLPAAHFFQTPHRKQKKIRFGRPLQKPQATALWKILPPSQTKQLFWRPKKPLTSLRKTCLSRKQPSPFSLFTIHWQTLKATASQIMTGHLELPWLKTHKGTWKMQNRSKQTLMPWIPAFYPKTSYTILSSYINTLLSSDGLELYDQPLSTTLGIQSQLPILLSEYTFYKKQDIDDYLSLLSSIDTYYDSLIAFETQRAQAGLGLCDTVIDNIIRSCNAYLIDADHSFLAETFASRLNTIDGLSDQEKADYKAKNKKAIDEHFVPAYERLITGLEGLKGKGTNDKGLYYYPEGRKYYEYLVNSSTGTSYSDVPALKQAINKQMAKELTAVNQLLNDDPSLGDKLDTSTFTLTKPQDILEDLKAQCQTDFPPVNDCNYIIKTVPKTLEGFLSPAFYLKVPIDRPEDNSIYINNKSTDSDSLYTTMAHEGYPGHMYQTLYFNQKNTCNLRNVLDFQGYTEGWGTYAEYYAFNLNNGLEENMGQLLQHNSAFTLALYALLDINIHYEGWNIDQVGEYLNMYFQLEDPSVISSIYYEVVENPANYLSYYTGYLELLNMQEEAKQQLGNNFSLLEFNRFILDIGPAPFSVIRNYFTQWLIQNSNNN